MKTLDTFFFEEPTTKPKPVKANVGKDDELFFKYMDEYKRSRRNNSDKAKKALDKAKELKDVSPRARMGAAYL